MRFLRLPEGFSGMFHGELRLFVPCLVILFAVVNGRGTMRLRRQFVKFRRTLMGILWHISPFAIRDGMGRRHFEYCTGICIPCGTPIRCPSASREPD